MEEHIKTLYVIPDTNVFVQCKQLEALNWHVLGNYAKFVLIITRPVITEVDHQKSGTGRLAKRAKLANSLFRKFFERTEIEVTTQGNGPELVAVLGQHFKPSSELASDLDYSHADDQIVGIAYSYQCEHPQHDVVFLSHDTGPLLMAQRIGVAIRQVPDDWLLNAENDEDQKRIKTLEADLKQIRDIQPQCTISFLDLPWKHTRQKRLPLTSEQISKLLDTLKSRYPMATDFGPSHASEQPEARFRFGIALPDRFEPASEQEISRYKEDYATWLTDCEFFFSDFHNMLNTQQETWLVKTALINDGGRPADDVIVSFEISSSNMGLMPAPSDEECSHIPEPLQLRPAPTAPRGGWVSSMPSRYFAQPSLMPEGLNRLYDGGLARLPRYASDRDANKFYWKSGRPQTPVRWVEFECAQWRHRELPEEFHLRLIINVEREPVRGALQVVVHAANLREPVKKIQSVEFIVEEVDAFIEAQALIPGGSVD